MFTPRSPESYLSRSITAAIIAERHARAGNRRWARVWRQIADQFRATAARIARDGRPAAEMAVFAEARV